MKTEAVHLIPDLNELLNEFGRDFSELVFNEQRNESNIVFSVEFEGEKKFYEYPFEFTDPILIKRYEKRYAKLSLYKFLSGKLNIDLPWGALTGVRPTKLARQTGAGFKDFFLNDMFVSEKKTELVSKILKKQEGLISRCGESTHLFICVPLCPTRCSYCSFISCEISKEKRVNEYIDGLIKEIEHAKTLRKNFKAVYIGGGTPVALDNKNFERLLSAIGTFNGEYTVEAGRPDAIDEEKLSLMKKHNVTRVCVNPQTFNDKTLELIDRKHTAKEVFEKFSLVRSYGFSINMDLIAGLPEENFCDFKNSLDLAISLRPENVTVHTLSLKSGSKLKESVLNFGGSGVSQMVDYAHETLFSAGYEPYYLYRQKYMTENLENTGYCRSGYECVYNIDVMEETANIVACGANAISKAVFSGGEKIKRLGEPKDIASYLKRLDQIMREKEKLFKQTT